MRELSFKASGLRRTAKRLARGWPATLGLFLLVAAGTILFAAAYIAKEANGVLAAAHRLEQQLTSMSANVPGSAMPEAELPDSSLQLEDVSTLFRTLERHKAKAPEILYGVEQPAPGVIIRVVDLRLDEEYSTLKETISDLLRKLPNGYLEMIQVDQNSRESTKLRAALRFRLAYEDQPATDTRAQSSQSGSR